MARAISQSVNVVDSRDPARTVHNEPVGNPCAREGTGVHW